MYVVIVGSGRLGSGLAKVLAAERYDVAVVDRPLDRSRLGSGFDGLLVEGNPMDRDALEAAGIRKADLLVSATADDNVNAAVIQMAKELYNVPSRIVRFTDPERERFYAGLGYDTICPTSTGVNQVLDMIRTRLFSALNAPIDPSTVCVLPREDWIGQSLAEIALPRGRACIGVYHAGHMMPPGKKVQIREGDTLVIARHGRS